MCQKLKAILKEPQKLRAKLNKIILEPDALSIEITPTKEEQIKEGFFDKVIVQGYGNREVRRFNSIEEMNDTVGEEELAVVYAKQVEKFVGIYKYENGTWNLISPKDTLEITENGQYDVSNYAETNVDVNLNVEITDGSYLFYQGARSDYINEIIALCKNLTKADCMFYQCTKIITIPDFDTSEVTSMKSICTGCSALAEMPNWDTSKVISMNSAFNGLTITEFPQYNTKNVEDMSYMLDSCKKLITLAELNAEKCIKIGNVLGSCTALTNFGGFKNLGKAFTQKTANYSSYKLNLSSCTKLTHESLINVINNLYDLNLTYDVANGGTLYTQTLQLGSTNLAKLTPEEIAIATSKGWTVS